MTLLATHLEQISISCQGIDSLPFPPPKIFTNALLSNHDITSLIRDTETHERALFSVPPPAPPSTSSAFQQQPPTPDTQGAAPTKSSRRQTVFNVHAGEVTTGPANPSRSSAPRRNTAVAAVLGGEMHSTIMVRQGGRHASGRGVDAVDIEVLLRGAEKLCAVYPLPGAEGRVAGVRQRWAGQANTLVYYEAKVAEQSQRLGRLGKRDEFGEDQAEEEDEGVEEVVLDSLMTEEDLRREEQEVRELDAKKKELQERSRALDKDLAGLLNM